MITSGIPLAVEMRGIVKRFPGVTANDHLDFSARKGEVHTLLGENGAGKSTLMQVLSGLYTPEEGRIFIDGRPVSFHSPRDSIRSGIGMIYQHFMLVQKHTVLENVILGLRRFGMIIDYRKAAAEIKGISRDYGLEIDPEIPIWQLSVGRQQRVEIIKMLFRRVEILILDEPTAVLTPGESRELFRTIRVLTGEGKTIIFISHKLNEVMEISDRITILRQGKKVETVPVSQTSQRDLARLMVGREVFGKIKRVSAATPKPVLTIRGLKAVDDRFLPALRGIDLRVHQGEILGLAGVSGNGQKELEEILCGLRKPTGGEIDLSGRDLTGSSPAEIIAAGCACIPASRLEVGSAGGLNFALNLILKDYRIPPFRRSIFLNYRAVEDRARRLRKDFNIQVPDPSAPVRLLSGGNLQKVILARELSENPRFLLAVHPTRGLDVGASEYLHLRLEELKRTGVAILLISEDLEELVALSDRIAVIYEGLLTDTLKREEVTREKIGLLMTGQKVAS